MSRESVDLRVWTKTWVPLSFLVPSLHYRSTSPRSRSRCPVRQTTAPKRRFAESGTVVFEQPFEQLDGSKGCRWGCNGDGGALA